LIALLASKLDEQGGSTIAAGHQCQVLRRKVYLTTLCRIMEGRKDKRMAFRATIEQAQLEK